MPPAENHQPRAFEIDRTSFTIRLERLLDAPADAVFDAWTKAEEISLWWDPAGEKLAACSIELRPGGNFTFVPASHPDMPFAGTYVEIGRPNLLVFEAMGATGRVVLVSSGSKTRQTVTITCRSAEHLDQYIKMGVDVGTAQTMDNLVAFMRRVGAAA